MRQFSADFASDIASCRNLLRGGSRSFFAASLLLPKRVRAPATALYAFCRVADDAVDLGADPIGALAALTARLDAVYAGTPHDNPVDRAFAATVHEFAIPKAIPAALIEGLAWDSQGRRYENFDALQNYAARVAGSVGVMMALVMGVRAPHALARAGDLGVAMQLTNIARDIGEDARAGRLFLPLDWLAQAGVDGPAFLQNPQFTPAIRLLVERLLGQASLLYQRAAAGIGQLPLDCRVGIAAAGKIYAAIGHQLAALGYNSVDHRARVPGLAKLKLAGAAAITALAPMAVADAPALAANLFLINAVPASSAIPDAAPASFLTLLNLFERLEREQRRADTPNGSLA